MGTEPMPAGWSVCRDLTKQMAASRVVEATVAIQRPNSLIFYCCDTTIQDEARLTAFCPCIGQQAR
jgi:hypothetical protein